MRIDLQGMYLSRIQKLRTKEYVPDVDKLLLRCIRSANRLSMRKLQQRTRNSDDEWVNNFRDKVLGAKAEFERKFKQTSSDSIKLVYQLEKAYERQVTKLEYEYLFNRLAREGMTAIQRIQDKDAIEELFNKVLNFVGSSLRFFVIFYLPLPYDTNREIKGDHSKRELGIAELFRSFIRSIALEWVLHFPRQKPAYLLANQYIAKAVRTVGTSIYAGMDRGARHLPLHGDRYSLKYLDILLQEFKNELSLIPRVSTSIKTISQLLKTEYMVGSDEENRHSLIEQIKESEKSFKQELDHNNNLNRESQIHMQRLIDANCSAYISANYEQEQQRKRGVRARKRGNQLHDLLPKLLGLPYKTDIRDMIRHPERYNILDNGWLIGSEVSYFNGGRYGIIDLLVLKMIDINYEGTTYSIPRVLFVGDIKTCTYEVFTCETELRLKRWEKKRPDKIEDLKLKLPAAKIALKIVVQQQITPEEIMELTNHTSLNSQHLRQLAFYEQDVIDICNVELSRILGIPAYKLDEYRQNQAIHGIINVDTYYRSSKDIRHLTTGYWELVCGFLQTVENEGNDNADLLDQQVEVRHPEMSTLMMQVYIPPEIYSYQDTSHLVSHNIEAFHHHQYRQASLDIEMYYLVDGIHQSGRYVSSISGLHYMLKHLIKKDDKNLLFDISDSFQELVQQRIVGYKDPDPEVAELLEQIELMSIYYPDSPDLTDDQLLFFDKGKSYDTIVLYGLHLYDLWFDDGVTYTHIMQLVSFLQHYTNRIIIVRMAPKDVTISPLYRRPMVLPYSYNDKYLAPNFLIQTTSIHYDIPRAPQTDLMTEPQRDEERFVVSFPVEKNNRNTKDRWTINVYHCERFQGESHLYKKPDQLAYLLANPREMSTVQMSRIMEIASLFRDGLGLQFNDYYRTANIQPTLIKNRCELNCNHFPPGKMVYDPWLDLSEKLKYSVPLLPGHFRSFKAPSQPKPARTVKTYSTSTPPLSLFNKSITNEEIVDNIPLYILEMDLYYILQIEKIFDPPSRQNLEDVIQNNPMLKQIQAVHEDTIIYRGYKLFCVLQRLQKKMGLRVASLKSWINDFDILLREVEMISGLSEDTLIFSLDEIEFDNRVSQLQKAITFNSITDQRQLGNVTTRLLRIIFDQYIETYGSNSRNPLPRERVLGVWLIFLMRLACRLVPRLDFRWLFSILQKFISWIGIQLELAMDSRLPLADIRYIIRPERIFYNILEEMLRFEKQSLQQVIHQEMMLEFDAIEPLRLCFYSSGGTLSYYRQNILTTKRFSYKDMSTKHLSDLEIFSPGNSLKFGENELELLESENKHNSYLIYAMRRGTIVVLYLPVQDTLVPICQTQSKYDWSDWFTFYPTMYRPISTGLIILEPFDHEMIDHPIAEYTKRIAITVTVSIDPNETTFVVLFELGDEILFQEKIFETRKLFDFLIESQSLIGTYEEENVLFVYNCLHTIPNRSVLEFEEGKLIWQELRRILSYLYHYTNHGHLPSSCIRDTLDFLAIINNQVETELVEVTIGITEERIVPIYLKEIEVVGTVIQKKVVQEVVQKDVFYINSDHVGFCRTVTEMVGKVMEIGENTYFTPYEIRTVLEKQVLTDSNDEYLRYIIDLKHEFDNRKIFMDDHEILKAMIVYDPYLSDQVRRLGSYRAEVRWEKVGKIRVVNKPNEYPAVEIMWREAGEYTSYSHRRWAYTEKELVDMLRDAEIELSWWLGKKLHSIFDVDKVITEFQEVKGNFLANEYL